MAIGSGHHPILSMIDKTFTYDGKIIKGLSDHDVIVDGEILSLNMMKQCIGSNNRFNNGFGKAETLSEYNARLEALVKELAEIIGNNQNLHVICLQETPDARHPFWQQLQTSLKSLGFNVPLPPTLDKDKCLIVSDKYDAILVSPASHNALLKGKGGEEKVISGNTRAVESQEDQVQFVDLYLKGTDKPVKSIAHIHYKSFPGWPKQSAIDATENLLKKEMIVVGDSNAAVGQFDVISQGLERNDPGRNVVYGAAPNSVDVVIYPKSQKRVSEPRVSEVKTSDSKVDEVKNAPKPIATALTGAAPAASVVPAVTPAKEEPIPVVEAAKTAEAKATPTPPPKPIPSTPTKPAEVIRDKDKAANDLKCHPEPDLKHPADPRNQLTIGDLHGNALTFIHFLIKQNVLVLKNSKDYDDLVRIYSDGFTDIMTKAPDSKGVPETPELIAKYKRDVDLFKKILSEATVIPDSGTVRLIGDEVMIITH